MKEFVHPKGFCQRCAKNIKNLQLRRDTDICRECEDRMSQLREDILFIDYYF